MSLDMQRPGAWTALFPKALELMAHLEARIPNAPWTFGGGTVLMLRIGHRQSKDIDLFVPDPQYIGYVNPRLSEVAAGVSADYEEAAEFIKLFLPDGEIDVVAGPALTARPFDLVGYGEGMIRVETSAEIIAKKMWHRGDRAKGRDLYDLCSVANAEPEQISVAGPFMARHARAFLCALSEREEQLRREFVAIDAIGEPLEFDACLQQAETILGQLL